MSNIIKKISVKTVCGDVKKLMSMHNIKKQTAILRVYGTANGVQTGSSNFGEWTALKGMFKAVNLLTGEAFNAGKCFLPDVAMDSIVPVVISGQPVEFAIDVFVSPSDTVAVGYEYNIKPLVAVTEDSALARLEQQIAAALPAPKKGKTADAA